MVNVGVTASREGLTLAQVRAGRALVSGLENVVLHHGDCVGGDYQLHALFAEIFADLRVVLHPPKSEACRAWTFGDEVRPPKDFLLRNKDIVNETNVLLAFPDGPEVVRSGTWSTVRYAKKVKKPWVVIYPDGRIERSS